MDWEKVKKIVIVLLVLLNLGLLTLNLYDDRRHSLSAERIATVTEVASRSGVTLACELPTRFDPMRELALSVPAAEVEKLQKQYFGSAEGIEVTAAGGGIFLQRGNEALSVSNNLLFYENPQGRFAPESFTEDGARASAEAFIRSLSGGADSVKEAYVTFANNCYSFTYYGLYKGHPLYSASRQIQVTKNGVVTYFVEGYTPQGYTGSRKNIYAADEALLTYCRLRADSGRAEGTVVSAVELGYAIDSNADAAQSGGVTMVPCYAVYAAGEGAPTLINALTNTVIS